MSLYMKLAWRNIFRNKRRTIIASVAIGLGLASLIYFDALVIGMEENMVKSATESFMGEGQIHHAKFREGYEVENTIHNADSIISSLRRESIVRNFSERTIAFSMITSPANVSAVSMVGIDPDREKYMSQIDDAIVEGAYFESDDRHDIVIGSKLAEILEVELGDRIVLTSTQAETGDLSQEMFRISGIYHFNIDELDRSMAFIHLDKAQEMLGLDGRVHEIALKFTDPNLARDRDLPFWKKYSQNGNEAVGWTILLPQLDAALKLSQFSALLLGLILFGIISLGIINTLFMSLHERMFEFGVLRAVGTRPLAMGKLILYEGGSLALIAIILGTILGFIATYITIQIGIDYSGIEFAGATFKDLLYPVLTVMQFIKYPILVFILTIIIAAYPARYAAKMKPAEAMRKSF